MVSVPPFQVNPYPMGNVSASQDPPQEPAIETPIETPSVAVPLETENQTQTYAQTEMIPSALAFEETLNPAQLIDKARSESDRLTPRQHTQLDKVAKDLGFPSGQSLSHALRYLPPEQVSQWQAGLATLNPGPDQLAQAQKDLSALATAQIETLFSEMDLPAPVFRVEGGSEWNASAYLAVFNNFKTMQSNLPPAVLQSVGTGDNQQPLEFVRRDHPRPLSEPGSFMEVLSNSMKIAHTDADHKIYLYDAAVSMDPQDILKSPDLQDYVAQINAKPPSEAHVRSLQEMLNASLPASKQIETNGQMDPTTWAALSDFDNEQFLRQAEDILRDDSRLPSADRQRIQTQIDNLRHVIANPDATDEFAAYGLRDQLVDQMAAVNSLSPAGQRRMDALLEKNRFATCSNHLKQEQVEVLLSNWLGIIDGGNQLDFTEQVINHELGHIFQEHWLSDWSKISFQNFDQNQTSSKEFMIATIQHHESTHANEDMTGFGSDYARVNPEEDFAESFRLFTRHPEQLLEQNLLKFMYMAGATGGYAGREDELVSLAQEHGYTRSEIQHATRTLRGQSQEHHLQVVDGLVEKGLNWFNQTWMANGLRNFGYEQGQDVRQEVVGAAAANVAYQASPQFNMNSASLLPGLEGALDMRETSSRAIHPSQEGYVMTWLEDKAALLYKPNATAAEKESAQQELQNFFEKGLTVFPAATRSQMPAAQQSQVDTSAQRAMMLSLAHFEAIGQVIRGLSQQNQETISEHGFTHAESQDSIAGLQETFVDLRALMSELSDPENMQSALQETIGETAFSQLPRSFLTYLSEPETLSQITGYMGRAQLGSGVALRSVEQEVAQRETLYQSAVKELTDISSNLMFSLSNLGFEEDSQGDIVVSSENKELMVDMMKRLFRDFSVGRPELQSAPNARQLENLLETMAEKMQAHKVSEVNPESLSMEAMTPQIIDSIRSTLIENLMDLNQVDREALNELLPELQDVGSIS